MSEIEQNFARVAEVAKEIGATSYNCTCKKWKFNGDSKEHKGHMFWGVYFARELRAGAAESSLNFEDALSRAKIDFLNCKLFCPTCGGRMGGACKHSH